MQEIQKSLACEHTKVTRDEVVRITFEKVFDQYFPRIFKYMLYQVRDPQIADELTSLTFERALINFSDFQPERGPINAWLFGIARHVASEHFRKWKRHRWLSLDFLSEKPGEMLSPEEAAISQESIDRLLAVVYRLKDRDREIIALKFAEGFNNRQIAKLTNLTETNVGVILYRALKRIQAFLTEGKKDE